MVLFNFRCHGQNLALWGSFGVRVHGRGEHSIDGVKYFEQLLQDGKLYGVEEVLVPKQCILVHKDLQEAIVHRDLSQYTRPGIRDLNGSELLQVHERDQNWVVRLKPGRKRSRNDAEECLHVRQGGGGDGGYGSAGQPWHPVRILVSKFISAVFFLGN